MAAEIPIITVEVALAVIFSFALIAPRGVPWWAPAIAVASMIGAAAAPRRVSEVSWRYLLAPARGGKPREPSTVENVQSETRTHLVPFVGDRPFGGIDANDVADLIATLAGKGLAPKSIRNIIGTLSALFNFAKARRRQWATSNPCEGAELQAIAEVEEIRFLTRAELERLTEHARAGMYHEIDRVLYLVAAMTGLRLGDLLALRWRDVDWIAGVIRVPAQLRPRPLWHAEVATVHARRADGR